MRRVRGPALMRRTLSDIGRHRHRMSRSVGAACRNGLRMDVWNGCRAGRDALGSRPWASGCPFGRREPGNRVQRIATFFQAGTDSLKGMDRIKPGLEADIDSGRLLPLGHQAGIFKQALRFGCLNQDGRHPSYFLRAGDIRGSAGSGAARLHDGQLLNCIRFQDPVCTLTCCSGTSLCRQISPWAQGDGPTGGAAASTELVKEGQDEVAAGTFAHELPPRDTHLLQ